MRNTTKNIGIIQMAASDIGVDLLRLDTQLYVPEKRVIVTVTSKENPHILPDTTAGEFIETMPDNYDVVVKKQNKQIEVYASQSEMITEGFDNFIGDISIVINLIDPRENDVFINLVDDPRDITEYLSLLRKHDLSNVYDFHYNWMGSEGSTHGVTPGYIASDDLNLSNITKLYIHEEDYDFQNMSEFIPRIKDYHKFTIHKTEDAEVKYDFTITNVVKNGDIFELDATINSNETWGLISVNDDVSIRWLSNPTKAIVRLDDMTLLPIEGNVGTLYIIKNDPDGIRVDNIVVWDEGNFYRTISQHVFLRELLTDTQTAFNTETGNIDAVMNPGTRELNIYDGVNWRNLFSETEIREWIVAASRFEGVVAENGHSQGPGVKELSELALMMGTMTDAEKLIMVGHYYTWNGTDGYEIQAGDLGGALTGALMQTNDWMQMVNNGGDVTDPNDPLYATEKPEIYVIHIIGDNISKTRADGLYSFEPWSDGSYEKGSIITYGGKVYKSTAVTTTGAGIPNHVGSPWLEVDLGGVETLTYFGRGGFDHGQTTFDVTSDYGMPAGTHPDPAIRPPLDGDRYVDLDHGSEVDFAIDPVTGVATVTHFFGHTREFHLQVTAGVDKNFEILDTMPLDSSDITITIEADDDDGSVYEFRYLSSTGSTPLISPIAINANNSGISKIGGLVFASKGFIMGTSSDGVARLYHILIHSKMHDLSNIKVGKGTDDTATFVESVDGLTNYPTPTARNIISNTSGVPSFPTPDYKGQVLYNHDPRTDFMQTTAIADTDTTWRYLSVGRSTMPSTGGKPVTGMLVMTPTQYGNLATKNANTLYFIEKT